MILITGCIGYIGYKLARAFLNEGHQVIGVALPKDKSSPKATELIRIGAKIYWQDITSSDICTIITEDISEIYHLAGIHASINKMENVFIKGCRNILLFASKKKVNLVLITSSGAYGATNLYGNMIRKMEAICMQEFYDNQLPIVILRIGEVYGDVTPELKRMEKQHLSLLGKGNNYISIIHIEDLIEIIKLASSSFVPGEIYNAVDNVPISQKQYYEYLCNQLNLLMPRWIGNVSNIRIQNSIHGLRSLSIKMSSKKLIKTTGYCMKYPSYKEGIENLKEKLYGDNS